ncbi:MAG: PIG-L deacetylase family protein [Dehalococcoidia bacterium]
MVADGENKRALVVAAHPDDADFGAGGTATLWTREGWEFYFLVCTDGSKGTSDPEMTSERLVPMRRQEQRAAAEVYGVKDCFFLDHVDGELTVHRRLLGEIVRHIRMIQPSAVFTHSIDVFHRNAFINHSDHRAVGQTTIDAVYPTARDFLNFPEQIAEGLQTCKVRELYLWGATDSNFDVDISDVVETKVDGLMKHASQFGQREDFMQFVRERWRDESGRFLERFQKITMLR